MKLTLFFLCFFTLTSNAQLSLNKNYYLSIEPIYRSYGKGDQTGYGAGIEHSKDIKNWLGIGINASYWNNNRKSWDFVNPFTSERFIYTDNIQEFRIHPFVQLFPINTKHIDVYIQLGFSTGYFKHIWWQGGYSTFFDPPEFINFVENKGVEGMYFGYDFGLAIRFQFGHFIIVPNSIKSFNLKNKGGFDSLNLKIGWNF